MRNMQMLLRTCNLLFIICSGCCSEPTHKSAPNIKLCISKPSAGGFICNDGSIIYYQDSDKIIGLSPDDTQILLNYCVSQQ